MTLRITNPFIIFIFFVIFIIGSVLHLVFGSCQTSKWHFIAQRYYLNKYLPTWVFMTRKYTFVGISIYENYTGVWKEWYKNGELKNKIYFVNGKCNGIHESWYENGRRRCKHNYINDITKGKQEGWYENGNRSYLGYFDDYQEYDKYEEWFENGNKSIERIYVKTKLISSIEWNEDGSLKLKRLN